MAKLQKKRSEVNDNYKWDLTLIYASDEDWYKSLEEVSKIVVKIKDFEGTLAQSAENLLNIQHSNTYSHHHLIVHYFHKMLKSFYLLKLFLKMFYND